MSQQQIVSTQVVGGTGGSLEIKEVDGVPDVSGVSAIVVSNGSLTDNSGGQVTITTGGGAGTGTVTSVAATVPTGFSVAGSPVTTTGTLAVTLDAQSGHKLLASPDDGSSGTPAFRALVAADIPAIAESGVTSLTTDLGLKAPVANPTFTGTTTAPEFSASGLTGAVAATRYAGGTNSGAPVSGTFAVGDFVVARDGHVFVCTTGGTPGTWADAGTASGMSGFTLAGDGGTPQSITDTNTLTVAGGVGLISAAGATDTVTVDLDINSLTADATPDSAADYVATYDASAATSKKVLLSNLPAGAGGLYSAYLCYQDQKTVGSNALGFTSGAWRTRELNTEVADAGNHGTLASNQITLDAGTYRCIASAPALYVQKHQTRLQDVTHTVTLLTGTSEYTDNAGGGQTIRSFTVGRFTIASSSAIELQHQCSLTNAGAGAMGEAASFGTEVYAVVELFKEA